MRRRWRFPQKEQRSIGMVQPSSEAAKQAEALIQNGYNAVYAGTPDIRSEIY